MQLAFCGPYLKKSSPYMVYAVQKYQTVDGDTLRVYVQQLLTKD